LILIPILFVWGDGFRPDFRMLPKVFMLFYVLVAVAEEVNKTLGVNYMYLSSAPSGSLLVTFERWFGKNMYILPELILILMLWTAMYSLRKTDRIKNPELIENRELEKV